MEFPSVDQARAWYASPEYQATLSIRHRNATTHFVSTGDVRSSSGMLLFLLGSALSGTSQSMPQLIAYRALQGVGAGAMMQIAQAIIADIFPPAERGK